jgi:hypothetical protein
MKKREQLNKRKEKERGRGTGEEGEKKREKGREWGPSPFCIGHEATSCIFWPFV